MNIAQFTRRAIVAFLSLVLVAGIAAAQNLNLTGGGGTLGGTWNVKGNVNNDGATGAYDFSRRLNLSGTTAAQNLGGTTATQALTIDSLYILGTQNVTQNVTVTVDSAFDIDNAGTPPTYSLTDNTLNLGGSTATTNGTFDASNASGIVNYVRASGTQSILASTYGGTLGLQGNATKSFTGATTAATVTHAGSSGALTVNFNLTINGATTSTLDAVTVNNGITLDKTAGDTLKVATLSGNSGTIQASAGVVNFLSAVTNAGSITTATGEVDFDGDLTISATTGSMTVTGAGTARFGGSVTNNNTFTFATNSNAIYDGTGAQSIPAPSTGNYYHLTLSGNSTKTATGNITLDGNFDNQGTTSLDMGTGSNSLTATGTYTQASGAKVRFGGSNHGRAISSGIIEYYGNIAQTIALGSYNTLELTTTGTSTKSFAAGTVSTLQNLTVPASVTLDLTNASSVLSVTGSLTVATSGALSSIGTVTTSGDFVLNGSITNSGTINVGL